MVGVAPPKDRDYSSASGLLKATRRSFRHQAAIEPLPAFAAAARAQVRLSLPLPLQGWAP